MIRFQEQDLKFNGGLVQMMLTDTDLYKIKQKASWDESTKEWQIPFFLVKEKGKGEVQFPTINGKARVEQHRQDREVEFKPESTTHSGRSVGRQFGNFKANKEQGQNETYFDSAS